jgi:hypothetical protein
MLLQMKNIEQPDNDDEFVDYLTTLSVLRLYSVEGSVYNGDIKVEGSEMKGRIH